MSSQKKSLPPPASEQEQIGFRQYDGRTVEEYYVQRHQYVPRGHQDRGDASTRPLPTVRASNGSRSPDTHAKDEPEAQVPESHRDQSQSCHRDQSPAEQSLMCLLVPWELPLT